MVYAENGKLPRLLRASATIAAVSLCVLADMAAAALPHHGAAHRAEAAKPDPTHAIPVTGVLSTEDLIAIARKADAERGSVDQFTDSPTNIYAGRTFHAAGIEARSYYDLSNRSLQVMMFDPRAYIISNGKSSSSESLGQNAYGARAKITSINTRSIEILGQMAAYKFQPSSDKSYDLQIDLPMDPTAAKELSQHLTWVVDGTLVKSPRASGGRADVVERKIGGTTATVAAPFEIKSDDTEINANIEKVNLVDSTTGKVVATGGPQ